MISAIFRHLVLGLLVVLPASLTATFGDPRGFLSNETVTETVLHQGVKLYRADGRYQDPDNTGDPSRAMVTHVVTVDLQAPNVRLQTLPGARFVGSTQFHRRSLVSQLQADNNALVAINTAFFDISNPGTQTPTGLQMRDGIVLREGQFSPARNTLLVSEDGTVAIGQPTAFSANIYRGTAIGLLAGVNRNSISGNQIIAYRQPWDRSPGTSAGFVGSQAITEVVLRQISFQRAASDAGSSVITAEVLSVRNDQPSITIGADEIVLSGVGTGRTYLQQMTVGSTVELRWQIIGVPTGVSWSSLTEVVAGSNLLVVDGSRQLSSSDHWNDRHPRSAVGLSQDGTRMLLLLVEGRQTGRAEGMSLHNIGRYLQHMGVHNGLEFDGGGSSALAARVNGINQRVSTPSDGSERYVPIGLGVMVDEELPNPFFENIHISPGIGGRAMVTWETQEPAISYVSDRLDLPEWTSAHPTTPATKHLAIIEQLPDTGPVSFRLTANVGAQVEKSHLLELGIGLELIMDDPEATFTGTWNTGAFATPWGDAYHHATTVTGTATATATYLPEIGVSGWYDVYVWYVQGTNRPTAAQYQVKHTNGTSSFTINQQTNGSQWRILASNLHFTAGGDNYLRVLNSASVSGAALMADGVRWVLKSATPPPAGTPPEFWTAHFFGSDNLPAGSVDADGDGFALWHEYMWLTDPTDRSSRPTYRIEPRNEGSGWTFSFSPWRPERIYRVQGRSNLTSGSWINLNLGEPAVNGTTATFTIADPAPYPFFRLEIQER